MVFSAQAEKRETKTLNKRIEKVVAQAQKEAVKLMRQAFGCRQDAERAALAFEAKLKYHRVNYQLEEKSKYPGRGRPAKDAQPVFSHYQLTIQIAPCADKIRPHRNKLGRFILATNDLHTPGMDAAAMLATYRSSKA